MKNLMEELLGSSDGSQQPKGFVFFTDDGVEGYTSKTDLRNSLLEQKNSKKRFRIGHLQRLFDNLSLGRAIIGDIALVNDDGQSVFWVRFAYGKTRQNLQILDECGMFNFVKDYANGRIQNVPTFKELIKSISQE